MFHSSAIAAGIGTEIQDGGWHIPISIDEVDFKYLLTHRPSGEDLALAHSQARTSSLMTLLKPRGQTAPQRSNLQACSEQLSKPWFGNQCLDEPNHGSCRV